MKERQKRRGKTNISNETSSPERTVMVSFCTQEETSGVYFYAFLSCEGSILPQNPVKRRNRATDTMTLSFKSQLPLPPLLPGVICLVAAPHCHLQKLCECVRMCTHTHIYVCMCAFQFYSSLGRIALGDHSPTSTVFNERGLATHFVTIPASWLWHCELPGLAYGLCCQFLSLPLLARRHLDWCKTQAWNFQFPALRGFSDWIRNLVSQTSILEAPALVSLESGRTLATSVSSTASTAQLVIGDFPLCIRGLLRWRSW